MTETTALAAPINRLSRDQLVAACKENPEAVADQIEALVRVRTASLPDTIFVSRGHGDNMVLMKQIRVGVKLTESAGELIKIGGERGKWDLTIGGLRRLNQFAALQIIRPETVIVDGKQQMNPYISVDKETRQPEVVYSRCLCVGYSPMGTLVATDVMIRLDVNIYLLENIQSKMKRAVNNAGRIGVYGGPDQKPTNQDGNEREGLWQWIPLHSIGNIGLWVNLAAPEIQGILGDHTTRVKFIERLAQSFSERNAMKTHPAAPKLVQVENGTATVTVHGWVADFDRAKLDELRELVEQDRLNEFSDGENIIDVEATVVEDVDPSEMRSVEEEVDQAVSLEQKEAGESEGEELPDEAGLGVDKLAEAGELFSRLVALGGRANAKAVLEELEIDNLEEASTEALQKFIEKASALLEKPASE